MSNKRKLVIIVSLLCGVFLFLAAGSFSWLHKQRQTRQEHSPDITVQQFIRQVAPAAQREQKKYHIPASITIAQAGLESNWGRSKLAAKYNNLFGIKANGKKNRVRMATTENVNGKTVKVKQYFQTYSSWAASINAHTQLIVNGTSDDHARFRAVQTAKNYRQAALALQTGGYATDPDYASKLVYAIKKFNLDRYDK